MTSYLLLLLVILLVYRLLGGLVAAVVAVSFASSNKPANVWFIAWAWPVVLLALVIETARTRKGK